MPFPLQLLDPASGTCTYLLHDPHTREALIIDPVDAQIERDLAVLQARGLRLCWAVETHNHADHITSAALLAEHTGARTAAPAACGIGTAQVQLADGDVLHFGGEQLRALRELNIPYTVTPGVPSFSAAAAALEAELTLPGSCQSVVLTRTSGRASSMPDGETLAAFAATGAVLAIHLSVHVAEQVQQELTSHYGPDCPAAIVWRASWPDEQLLRTRVGDIASAAQSNPLQRSALILVGATLNQQDFGNSRLYANDYDRRYRPRGDEPRFPRGSEGA